VRSRARVLTAAVDIAIGVASVTAAVVVIAFRAVVLCLHVPVRAGSARTWRWTNDNAPVPPGTRVTRGAATVLPASRGEGDG